MNNLSKILLSLTTPIETFYELLETNNEDDIINAIEEFITSEENYKNKLLRRKHGVTSSFFTSVKNEDPTQISIEP